MSYLDGFYLNPHVDQFDGSEYAGENCTPTTGANGANASTGGSVHLTGAQVRHLVPCGQETNPNDPGWSLGDLDLAMSRAHVPFLVRSGQGWSTLVNSHKGGFYLALQGDSDQFSNATCSGKFNGDHCIGIHPATRISGGVEQWWIDDPICNTGRWESRAVIQRYGQKLLAEPSLRRVHVPGPEAADRQPEGRDPAAQRDEGLSRISLLQRVPGERPDDRRDGHLEDRRVHGHMRRSRNLLVARTCRSAARADHERRTQGNVGQGSMAGMTLVVALYFAALILAFVEEFQAHGRSILGYAVILIAIALLWGHIG